MQYKLVLGMNPKMPLKKLMLEMRTNGSEFCFANRIKIKVEMQEVMILALDS
jgi:hypothetical protein